VCAERRSMQEKTFSWGGPPPSLSVHVRGDV
jgi:hypothetical protein